MKISKSFNAKLFTAYALRTKNYQIYINAMKEKG